MSGATFGTGVVSGMLSLDWWPIRIGGSGSCLGFGSSSPLSTFLSAGMTISKLFSFSFGGSITIGSSSFSSSIDLLGLLARFCKGRSLGVPEDLDPGSWGL
jgi:hypothetical protein